MNVRKVLRVVATAVEAILAGMALYMATQLNFLAAVVLISLPVLLDIIFVIAMKKWFPRWHIVWRFAFIFAAIAAGTFVFYSPMMLISLYTNDGNAIAFGGIFVAFSLTLPLLGIGVIEALKR